MDGSECAAQVIISPAICPSVNVNSCERKQIVGLFTLLEQVEKVREKVLFYARCLYLYLLECPDRKKKIKGSLGFRYLKARVMTNVVLN